MFCRYILPILLLAFTCVFGATINSQPEEQLKGPERTWTNGEYRLGLPGLANIRLPDEHGISHYHSGVMPEQKNKLIVHLEHDVSYGGKKYQTLTIASGGRIFLGDYKDYRLPEEFGRGLYPYVKAVEHEFVPVAGASEVPVIWRKFEEHGDVFTAVEFGPFNIVGHADPLICQVSFYTDGEIQVQYWNLNRKDAYLVSTKGSNFVEKDYIGLPYVYTVGKKITLTKEAKTRVFTKLPEDIFFVGKLREGWIAKAFNADGPKIRYNNSNDIEVDFSSGEYPGIVIAYDHARENPIVGSFESLYLWTYDNGNDKADPVYFWYFNENSMFNNETEDAGYPYISDKVDGVGSNKFELSPIAVSGNVPQNCISDNTIYPCAYGVSWHKNTGIIDTVAAPALKLQVIAKNTNRKIRIHRIRAVPQQPRSIQFKPPVTYDVEYEGEGNYGYLDVGGVRAPVSMAEKADVDAALHVLPGYSVEKIQVNGKVAYDRNDPLKKQNGIQVDTFPNQNLVTIRFPLISNVKIKVTYGGCSRSKIPEVIAAYTKSEIFLDPEDKNKVMETYSVKDGFGQIVQTQIPVNAGFFRISAVYSDIAGNALYAPKPYIVKKSTYSFEPMHCEQCVRNSAAYFSDANAEFKEQVESFGYPYIQHNYHYGENRAVVDEVAGMGEASFALSDKFAKIWKIPVKTTKTSEFFNIAQMQKDLGSNPNGLGLQFDNEYADRLEELDDDDLDAATEAKYPFELTVSQSIDGIITQSISDAAGNLMATWSTHDGEVLVKRYEYNSASQLIRTFVEGHRGFETKYTYDDGGRLIATEAPDRGRTETKYDSENRIRYTRDARQIAKGGENKDHFNVIIYDERDRIVQTGEVRGNCNGCSFDDPENVPVDYIHPIAETIYGVPSKESLTAKSSRLDDELADYIVGHIEGVGPNDVGATITYGSDGNVVSMKMASFDRLGQTKKAWLVYLVEADAPAIETVYEYTASGLVKRVSTNEWNHTQKNWNAVSKRVMEYGRFNRLEKVYEQELDNNNKSLLASYTYDTLGTLTKTTYYDKGEEVYTKTADGDIYGRTTRIGYKDAKGADLYEESLYYPAPLLNRVSSIKHKWNGNFAHQDSVIENFVYDDRGSLSIFETDMAGRMTNGTYEYDILGRLTRKAEAGSDIVFDYVDGSYRPVAVSVNGNEIGRALAFDPAGNLWLNGVSNVAYKLNGAGLPEKALRFGGTLPAGITLEQIDAGAVATADSAVAYEYDGVTRVYERREAAGGYVSGRVTVPGLGSYARGPETAFSMERLDLPGGGYRTGADGAALFPLTDAQGSIRGYANLSGVRSAHAYYPYGSVEDLSVDAPEDARRWQSKEFDGALGNYYFGARYYDPLLGLWMSPDPAGQFSNPYGYGGDPVNYVDPTGMWALGLGLVVGWDSQHGWQIGFGAALDLSNGSPGNGFGANLSYTWNQDDSESFNMGASGQYLWLAGGLSYSYNSYTGQTFSGNIGVCVGLKGVVSVGPEIGGSLYVNHEGDIMGATAYAELQASAFGGLTSAVVGYESGSVGMEGRGLFAGATVAGVHAEVSERGGRSLSFRGSVYYGSTDEGNDFGADNIHRKVSRLLWIPELGSLGRIKLGAAVDETKDGLGITQKKKILEMVLDYAEKNGDKESYDLLEILNTSYGDGTHLDDKAYEALQKWLVTKGGLKSVWRPSFPWDPYHKDTYANGRLFDYGNIEFKYWPGTKDVFSSYNYGNNVIDHIFLDMFGYLMSN